MKQKLNIRIMKSKGTAVGGFSPSYFDNFNWQNFEFGDIVWLEDLEGIDYIAGYFAGIHENFVVIRLIPNSSAIRASELEADNIHQIIGA